MYLLCNTGTKEPIVVAICKDKTKADNWKELLERQNVEIVIVIIDDETLDELDSLKTKY